MKIKTTKTKKTTKKTKNKKRRRKMIPAQIIIKDGKTDEEMIEELIEAYSKLYGEYIREMTQRNYILGAYESLRRVVESGSEDE